MPEKCDVYGYRGKYRGEKCNVYCYRKHVSQTLARINSPVASHGPAYKTMSIIILKAFVLVNSDKVKQLGCLRRREKLGN